MRSFVSTVLSAIAKSRIGCSGECVVGSVHKSAEVP